MSEYTEVSYEHHQRQPRSLILPQGIPRTLDASLPGGRIGALILIERRAQFFEPCLNLGRSNSLQMV